MENARGPLAQELASHPDVVRVGWPKEILTELAGVAHRCVYHYASRRSTVVAELPTLEATLKQAACYDREEGGW